MEAGGSRSLWAREPRLHKTLSEKKRKQTKNKQNTNQDSHDQSDENSLNNTKTVILYKQQSDYNWNNLENNQTHWQNTAFLGINQGSILFWIMNIKEEK